MRTELSEPERNLEELSIVVYVEEPGVKEEFGLPRAIFVNGKEIFWGYEAPESGIGQAIVNAINCS